MRLRLLRKSYHCTPFLSTYCFYLIRSLASQSISIRNQIRREPTIDDSQLRSCLLFFFSIRGTTRSGMADSSLLGGCSGSVLVAKAVWIGFGCF